MSDTVVPKSRAAPAERVHVTRSRAKPGGTAQVDGRDPLQARAQAAVAESAGAGRRRTTAA